MITNADVIRSMTDEELINFLDAVKMDDIDYSVTFCSECMKDKTAGGKGNALDYDCDACFRSWVLGSAYEYNGLLHNGVRHPNKNIEFIAWDVCTACGIGCKRREYDGGGMTEYHYRFCPNCGADMSGGKDD